LKEARTKTWRLPKALRDVQKALILSFCFLIIATGAWGGDYRVRRTVGEYTLEIALNQNPPILGKNNIHIGIRNTFGQYVADIPVTVNYYMPPMPGMPPMNYTLKATPNGSGYTATMDFIMTGPWNIVVRTNAAGKQLRLTVPIDVR
jgi:hypothetical protein